MRYLPHTLEQIQQMLAVVGADSLESLFSGIPEECRRLQEMNLPEALSEWALNRYMDGLSARTGGFSGIQGFYRRGPV